MGDRRVDLVCHPDAPCPEVRGLQVRVGMQDAHTLVLSYDLRGDLERLSIPGLGVPQRSDRLWERTCFEVFLKVLEGTDYREFNFSPSRAWATYAFRDYREGGAPIEGVNPLIFVRQGPDQLQLDVILHLDEGLFPQSRRLLRMGLSAVIERQDGSRSYWAIRHPHGRPDFHHADAYTLELDTGWD